jgi:hypothetical protein
MTEGTETSEVFADTAVAQGLTGRMAGEFAAPFFRISSRACRSWTLAAGRVVSPSAWPRWLPPGKSLGSTSKPPR